MKLIEGHTAADLEEWRLRAAILEGMRLPRDMAERIAALQVNRSIEQRKAAKGAA